MSAVNNMTLPTPKVKAGEGRTRALWIYTAVTLVALAIAFAMELFYAGTDVQQGEVQRLFYIHMGSFFGAFLAFGTAVFAGVAYLRTRSVRWDVLALSCIEVGIVLAFLNLATGSVWARPIWNTWWTWDPRLTSAAVMELTYVAYLMLRRGIENPETRRRFASIYGILAFSTVLFTLLVTRIRPDTIHPVVIGSGPATNTEGGFAVTQGIGITLGVSIIVWMAFLTPVLIWWRIRLENLNERIAARKAQVQEA
jgi:heme exporter protein C